MTPFTGTSFSDSLAASADRQRLQMWQAAKTVRAHVGAGEEREDLLACLGLSDVEQPGGSTRDERPAGPVLPWGPATEVV